MLSEFRPGVRDLCAAADLTGFCSGRTRARKHGGPGRARRADSTREKPRAADPVIAKGTPALLCFRKKIPPSSRGEEPGIPAQLAEGSGATESTSTAFRRPGEPHFGGPLADRMKTAAAARSRFRFMRPAGDTALGRLTRRRARWIPDYRRGLPGLPLMEAPCAAVPCVCSDLRCSSRMRYGGGCPPSRFNDAADWSGQVAYGARPTSAENRRLQAAADGVWSLPRWAGDRRRRCAAGLLFGLMFRSGC